MFLQRTEGEARNPPFFWQWLALTSIVHWFGGWTQKNWDKELVRSVKENNLTLIQQSLQNGANAGYIALNEHLTPLIKASKNGFLAAVQALLDAGARVNDTATIHGFTALMYAAGFGHSGVATVLLDAGARVNVRDNYGYAALTVAARCGHSGVAQVLLNGGFADRHSDHSRAYSAHVCCIFWAFWCGAGSAGRRRAGQQQRAMGTQRSYFLR